MFSKKPTGALANISIIAGLVTGIGSYFMVKDPEINWFVGNVCSLFVPAIIVIVGSMLTKNKFDFEKMKEYNPSHKVHV
jgi:Na+/proline symporter